MRTTGRIGATVAAALAIAAAGAIGAAPAGAALGLACPTPASQVFAPWGDRAAYAFAPDGGLEGGGAGWTLTGGAGVVAGNETYAVHSQADRMSLSLPAGSSATTPPLCIGLLSSKMRFFAANGGAASSRLRVEALYGGGLGAIVGGAGMLLGISDAGSVEAGASWGLSQPVAMLGGTLPLLTQWVRFRFTPADAAGSWRIDDVYVDPMMHG